MRCFNVDLLPIGRQADDFLNGLLQRLARIEQRKVLCSTNAWLNTSAFSLFPFFFRRHGNGLETVWTGKRHDPIHIGLRARKAPVGRGEPVTGTKGRR